MKNIAVWYHIALSPPIDQQFGLALFRQQMALLEHSGLRKAAQHLTIGINGLKTDALKLNIPFEAKCLFHEPPARSELPTLYDLQQWLPGHEDWHVCYFHAKGITHANFEPYIRWRNCMEASVIVNWRRCIADLDRGYETVGCHWIDRAKYPRDHEEKFDQTWNLGGHIWGGNFWWAKSGYLRSLPKLPSNSTCRGEDFIAEIWIGSNKYQPTALDYAPHFPTSTQCHGSVKRCLFVNT